MGQGRSVVALNEEVGHQPNEEAAHFGVRGLREGRVWRESGKDCRE